ncbi:LuxR C-terminal-related transcriptional regulator [Streptomyces sp. NPDC059385]|uniref:helix-turn-helix transcriptional regulator n=1 Tax=Streptomyces sp. NPDC059385 TaxID=3346817 RepID=UPI00369C68C8
MDIPGTPGDASPLPLNGRALQAYEYACEREKVTPEEIASAIGTDLKEAEGLMRSLCDLHLLWPTPGGGYTASSPRIFGAQLIAPAVRELAERQQHIMHMMERLDSLAEIYEQSPAKRLRRPEIEVLPEVDSVRSALNGLSAHASQEILTSQPGGARPADVLKEALSRTELVLRRNVTMRTIYQHTAQFNPATRAYVKHVTPLGAQVRMLSDGFMRLIVFDRETAVLPLHGNPQGAVIVSDQSIVDFVVEAFERVWPTASPFPVSYDQNQVMGASEEIKLAISQLLVEGVEDKVIARRLGMSLRTCQRHISDVMARLGARNRLHAGYLLSKVVDDLR